MKPIFTFLFSGTIIWSAFGQNFGYDPGQEIDEILITDEYNAVHVNIETPVPEAIQYKWELISDTYPSGWVYSLCDYTSCYTGIPASGTMSPISLSMAESGAKGFFKVTVQPGTVYGTGTAKIYVYDSNDYDRGDTISITLTNLNQLSAENNSEESFSVNYIAQQNQIVMENLTSSALTYQLFNLSGQIISNGLMAGLEKSNIPTSSIKDGIYFVRITNENGLIETKKLMVY